MKPGRASDIAFILMTALALSVAGHSLKYTTGNMAEISPQFATKYSAMLPVVIAHGICAITALSLGPFQFIAAIRIRWRAVHRWLGRIYMAGVLVGSVAGFRMGLQAHTGGMAAVGFCTMAVLWFATGIMAWRTAVRGDFAAHRRWMFRNFALTFGAATFRLYLNTLQWMGFDYDAIYGPVTWAAWIPNLLIAEGLARGWFARKRAWKMAARLEKQIEPLSATNEH